MTNSYIFLSSHELFHPPCRHGTTVTEAAAASAAAASAEAHRAICSCISSCVPKRCGGKWVKNMCRASIHKNLHVCMYACMYVCMYIYRRKFRSQTSDNMDRWKAEQGRGREKRKIRREKIREEKESEERRCRCAKGRKVAKHYVFAMICGSGGSKSRLAKAAGAEPSGQTRNEKLHAVVAQSTFPSQNVQNTPCSDHFWKLRCQKSARCCGAKHISKSKCTKHTMLGPLLEVAMSKKCTLLWREAHFQVKMYKAHHARSTFGSCDVKKVHAVVARSTFRSENVQNTRGSDHFWRFRCRKSGRRCGAKHISKLKSTSFRVAGARDCAACQKWARHQGFVAFRKTMICKGAFSVAGAVQKTCSWEMLGGQSWFPERGCILEY